MGGFGVARLGVNSRVWACKRAPRCGLKFPHRYILQYALWDQRYEIYLKGMSQRYIFFGKSDER